ncbi:uncharacterized protein LOC126788568 [Argentina anserina]|uniref:uncharacterized protein LOC126788568 n=1 Tax=Argentina anserina TaxID=57926 RepID=UPI0021766F70|nr:uncharacterized protein LOC126788568 [Potentilla anserina]
MISVLAQERLLGAALGCIFTGIVVFEQRRSIYTSISATKSEPISQSQMREPIFGMKSRSEFAHLWNKAVDRTFQKAIESVTSSGW